jgi:hypothetical protein
MLRYLVTDVRGPVVRFPDRGAELGQRPAVALEAFFVAALEIAQVSERVQDAAGSFGLSVFSGGVVIIHCGFTTYLKDSLSSLPYTDSRRSRLLSKSVSDSPRLPLSM